MDSSGKSMDVPGVIKYGMKITGHSMEVSRFGSRTSLVSKYGTGIFQPCLITRGWGRGCFMGTSWGSLECMGM